MPQSWWGKALAGIYIVGWWVYFIWTAVAAWPHLSFFSWGNYVVFKGMYAFLWPLWLILYWFGFDWYSPTAK